MLTHPILTICMKTNCFWCYFPLSHKRAYKQKVHFSHSYQKIALVIGETMGHVFSHTKIIKILYVNGQTLEISAFILTKKNFSTTILVYLSSPLTHSLQTI